jgi:protease I
MEDMKTLILVADGFEDLSLFLPWYRLLEEGADVILASPVMRPLVGQHGYRVDPDTPIHEVNPAEYDLLIIPDGPASERLRLREEAVDVVRTFVQEGMLIACIGHGAQVLLSAGAIDSRTLTCSPGIRDDIRAAGAIYRDEAVVADGNLLTCRGAQDLPAFCHLVVSRMMARAL